MFSSRRKTSITRGCALLALVGLQRTLLGEGAAVYNPPGRQGEQTGSAGRRGRDLVLRWRPVDKREQAPRTSRGSNWRPSLAPRSASNSWTTFPQRQTRQTHGHEEAPRGWHYDDYVSRRRAFERGEDLQNDHPAPSAHAGSTGSLPAAAGWHSWSGHDAGSTSGAAHGWPEQGGQDVAPVPWHHINASGLQSTTTQPEPSHGLDFHFHQHGYSNNYSQPRHQAAYHYQQKPRQEAGDRRASGPEVWASRPGDAAASTAGAVSTQEGAPVPLEDQQGSTAPSLREQELLARILDKERRAEQEKKGNKSPPSVTIARLKEKFGVPEPPTTFLDYDVHSGVGLGDIRFLPRQENLNWDSSRVPRGRGGSSSSKSGQNVGVRGPSCTSDQDEEEQEAVFYKFHRVVENRSTSSHTCGAPAAQHRQLAKISEESGEELLLYPGGVDVAGLLGCDRKKTYHPGCKCDSCQSSTWLHPGLLPTPYSVASASSTAGASQECTASSCPRTSLDKGLLQPETTAASEQWGDELLFPQELPLCSGQQRSSSSASSSAECHLVEDLCNTGKHQKEFCGAPQKQLEQALADLVNGYDKADFFRLPIAGEQKNALSAWAEKLGLYNARAVEIKTLSTTTSDHVGTSFTGSRSSSSPVDVQFNAVLNYIVLTKDLGSSALMHMPLELLSDTTRGLQILVPLRLSVDQDRGVTQTVPYLLTVENNNLPEKTKEMLWQKSSGATTTFAATGHDQDTKSYFPSDRAGPHGATAKCKDSSPFVVSAAEIFPHGKLERALRQVVRPHQSRRPSRVCEQTSDTLSPPNEEPCTTILNCATKSGEIETDSAKSWKKMLLGWARENGVRVGEYEDKKTSQFRQLYHELVNFLACSISLGKGESVDLKGKKVTVPVELPLGGNCKAHYELTVDFKTGKRHFTPRRGFFREDHGEVRP
ncbi:unnamed protein product [Amoebophrya sp. A120]|nr:unnamed protein product [Amoebophrya sp. A120]|eukprot:GSA120T00001086001.1